MLNSRKKEFLYAASVFGPNLIFAMIMAYLSNSVNPANIVQDAEYWTWLPTVAYGATAAIAIIIPVAFGIFYTVGRFFDALIDLPIASRLDRMKNRYARLRLPIIIAFIPMVIGAIGLTLPLFGGIIPIIDLNITTAQLWGNTAWLFAMSILFFAASTICTVTFMSSLAFVCTSRRQRARVAFFKSFIDTVQFALAYALAPLIARMTGFNIMIVTAILIPTMITIFIPVIMSIGQKSSESSDTARPILEGAGAATPPLAQDTNINTPILANGDAAVLPAPKKGGLKGFFRDDAPEAEDIGEKKSGIFKSIAFVLKSKAFWPWLGVVFFTFLGLMLFLGAQNALVSGVLQLGVVWSIVLNSAAFGPVPIMLYLYNKILRRNGVRYAFRISLVTFAIGIACFSIGSAYFFPNAEAPRIIINMAGATFASFAIGSFFMMNAMLPAQVAATEKKVTGRNNTAMYFAGQSIIIGLATAIAGGLIWNVGLVGIGDFITGTTVGGYVGESVAGNIYLSATYMGDGIWQFINQYVAAGSWQYAGHHVPLYITQCGNNIITSCSVGNLAYYVDGRRQIGFVEGYYRIPIGGFIAPFLVAVCCLIALVFTKFMPKSYDAMTIGKLFDKDYNPDAADLADAEVTAKFGKKYAHIRGYDVLDGDWLSSLVLAFIPPFGMILGAVTRFKRRQIVFGILSILLNPVFMLADIISLIKYKRLDWLAYDTEKPKMFKDEQEFVSANEPVTEGA